VIEDVESMTRQQNALKETQAKLFPSMLIDQFLKENGNNEDEKRMFKMEVTMKNNILEKKMTKMKMK